MMLLLLPLKSNKHLKAASSLNLMLLPLLLPHHSNCVYDPCATIWKSKQAAILATKATQLESPRRI